MKPLGKKAYGSIPHLIGSKLGEGDHHIHEGQQRICTEKVRDKHDVIIIQEKYDGSCVSVCRINGQIIALTRSGYTAESSPYIQHHYFAKWVAENSSHFREILSDGERVVGEWMLQAHGLRYEIHNEPFIAFDLFTAANERVIYNTFIKRVSGYFHTPEAFIVPPCRPLDAVRALSNDSWRPVAALEGIEGVVYRVERNGKVDFLAKFVRADFVPGKYLPEISGSPEVFNVPLESVVKRIVC